MSTPLDKIGDIQSGVPPADEERVRRIVADMNAGEFVQQPPPPPPAGHRIISEPPISMSTGEFRMDVGTARANVIGNSTPTAADFQAMFQAAPPGMAPYQAPAISHGAHIPNPTKAPSWKSSITDQLRDPVVVAIIVFFLNMPIITSLLSRYVSWMYLSSGEISVGGLLVKALLAAFLFGFYRIVSVVVSDK